MSKEKGRAPPLLGENQKGRSSLFISCPCSQAQALLLFISCLHIHHRHLFVLHRLLLTRTRTRTAAVGLAFSCQVIPEVPIDEHDRKVGDVESSESCRSGMTVHNTACLLVLKRNAICLLQPGTQTLTHFSSHQVDILVTASEVLKFSR